MHFCSSHRHVDSISIMKFKEVSHAAYSGNRSLNILLCGESASLPFSAGPRPPLPPASLSQYPPPITTHTPTGFSQLSGKRTQAQNFLFELSKSIRSSRGGVWHRSRVILDHKGVGRERVTTSKVRDTCGGSEARRAKGQGKLGLRPRKIHTYFLLLEEPATME